MVKNLPASAIDITDSGSILGSGRFSGEGNGNPLQYSCLENSMDRGAWWATVAKSGLQSQTRLNRLSMERCHSQAAGGLMPKSDHTGTEKTLQHSPIASLAVAPTTWRLFLTK